VAARDHGFGQHLLEQRPRALVLTAGLEQHAEPAERLGAGVVAAQRLVFLDRAFLVAALLECARIQQVSFRRALLGMRGLEPVERRERRGLFADTELRARQPEQHARIVGVQAG
jgi:hypothetical protein